MTKQNRLIWLKALLLGLAMAGLLLLLISWPKPTSPDSASKTIANEEQRNLYDVISVIDGDTIKINYEGRETSVRLIGVNTPETVDPRTTVECFGQEASDYLKNLLTNKKVKIETDDTQTDRDKYDRLLRYVYLDGEDVGLGIINNGYGYEYTYNVPYAKQTAYKQAQTDAENNNRGLWADGVCGSNNSDTAEGSNAEPSASGGYGQQAGSESASSGSRSLPSGNTSTSECNIKGNINSSGEKIYHLPGQRYYDSTKIDTGSGERWFCSEGEALAAGWRKSKV